MVLSVSTIDIQARLGVFTDDPAIISITSWDAARRILWWLSWIIPVLQRYIRKEFPIQCRQDMMNSGDIPALSSRTQTQTLNKWSKYRDRLAFYVCGWMAFTDSWKSIAMRLPELGKRVCFCRSSMPLALSQADLNILHGEPFSQRHKQGIFCDISSRLK